MTTPKAIGEIQEGRVRRLNDHGPAKGSHVLYWMQQSQRATCNHALEYAIQRANELKQPLLVGFGLMDDYPEANLRHYQFMLEGLAETKRALHDRGICMVVEHGQPAAVALTLAKKASIVVCDVGYLRHQQAWRSAVAEGFVGEAVAIESDSVVPVEVASNKAEYAARTLRPKIHRHLSEYLIALKPTPIGRDSLDWKLRGLDLNDLGTTLSRLKLDRSVVPVRGFRGGTSKAHGRLENFIKSELNSYAERRNRPETAVVSQMSPYLHFGQISPMELALEIRASTTDETNRTAYLEELLIRRELAHNFVHYTPDYDEYDALPDWARTTLEMHRGDPRSHRYTKTELDAAKTHDPYWNAAMREMKATGYMHNHMRMYWGKKILEWSRMPQAAYRVALELNNRYFLDGRDPASYANVGWIFGLHDRPWPERAVYGTVRSMTASGLERKADMPAYIARVEEFERTAAQT